MNAGMKHESMHRRVTRLEVVLETILPTLATKADLAALRVELRAELHATLHSSVVGLETRLRDEMYRIQHSLLKWIIGIAVVLFLGLLGNTIATVSLVQGMVAPVVAAALRSAPAVPLPTPLPTPPLNRAPPPAP